MAAGRFTPAPLFSLTEGFFFINLPFFFKVKQSALESASQKTQKHSLTNSGIHFAGMCVLITQLFKTKHHGFMYVLSSKEKSSDL